MITHAEWQSMQTVRVAVLVCFVPVLAYRIWRLWRYPSLLPGKAVTGFGVLLWLWLLAFTDSVWSVLPTWLRAVSAGGWAAVTLAACLQAFVLSISGHTTPARIRRHLWITFTTAGCVLVVVAIATFVSDTSAVLQDPYVFTNSLMEGKDPGLVISSVTSTAYVALILVQLIWTGVRNASRTPVGIGLGLLAAASAVELVVLVSGGIWAPLAHGEVWEGRRFGPWFFIVPAFGVTALVMVGFLYPPISLHLQARRAVHALTPLRDALAAQFPGLGPPADSAMRLSDLAFEWTTHIQDGLTLLAQARGVPLSTYAPIPADVAARSASVANWVTDQVVPGFSCEWLQPPASTSDERWVLAIADAYRERQEDAEVPASLSGMPSTLRR
ncbi:Uncharacterised protein [Mycobacteroides abscessus subsp. bolletii]|uniref:Uncharacterized protein n=1 Tax=Mycobacteroides abscessus subsp. bolletii TaxID=319705 RepID=A0A9Q7WKU1_9MYCO|nr:hypothetical protein [Mycobacteroides abscessus]SHU53650.1 Uncharacterised protein [Mycobacteroides abscessus subsp. bolletii]SHU72494.1 Uncharacterised protein [Mycobacteroides abscessus subsp. bolletii]SHX84783.1 Uncharacterised protein [Mycobacteroides abscessus subsp. bolletii]SKM43685.1 Uncharacterised protein [Mycobacteroides abscessus subsp. bolletii]SKN56516.1 Uncharacterised protein [Mycobacteroides abscessus subsp. bolletii]